MTRGLVYLDRKDISALHSFLRLCEVCTRRLLQKQLFSEKETGKQEIILMRCIIPDVGRFSV